jgi:hemoglobin
MEHGQPPNRPQDVFTPPEGPPQGNAPSREIYAAMGQDNLFALCRDFYARLEQSPIRPMFPEDMALASEKLASFLSGLLGGPPLYHQRYGNPMMRARHLKFPIHQQERDVWLNCFKAALQDAPARYNFPAQHVDGFVAFLETFSRWMVNREG